MTDQALRDAAPITEAWIDSAGHTLSEIESMIESIASTVERDRPSTFLIVDRRSEEESADLLAVADRHAVGILSSDPEALNARLAKTTAEFLIVVRWGRPVPDLIRRLLGFFDRFPETDLVYGDSMTETGRPFLRPAFSPIRLRSNDYLGPVVCIRIDVLRRLGGLRAEARRAQVLDVALRAYRNDAVIALIPMRLATEDLAPGDFAGTSDAQRRVVESWLAAAGIDATVEDIKPFVRRVRYKVIGEPLISVVIPTRGSSARIGNVDRVLVVEAVRGIVERSTYAHLEFVVVADADTPVEVVDELEAICGDHLRLLVWDAPFNFSAKMNRGAAAARGEYLLLLNDDVEMVTDDSIETMLGLAQQDGVGIVGAQLYFEDSTVQHAGQVYTGGVAGHAAFGWPGGRDDDVASMITDHEVSGVTAACALMRRDLYHEVGGFTLSLPGNYNDVDLNLKVRMTGRSAIFTPWSRLYHFESKTRDPRVLESDLTTLRARWARRMQLEMYSRMLL
ncbi:glycosyltransferase family 2 protein [Agromyces humi]|uniref:glycosyltransferase family 2 protein n=1 Tax=Agromyces humi TaxID=1766800 RepID=UPI00135A8D11|nr:glycosyltransferase [Agromyces humi]